MGKFSIFDQVKKESRSIPRNWIEKNSQTGGISVVGNQIGKDPKRASFTEPENGFSCRPKNNFLRMWSIKAIRGVKLSLNNASDVKKAYDEILKR